eukprot:6523454-Lingulodinium_polyedra.AAC.1
MLLMPMLRIAMLLMPLLLMPLLLMPLQLMSMLLMPGLWQSHPAALAWQEAQQQALHLLVPCCAKQGHNAGLLDGKGAIQGQQGLPFQVDGVQQLLASAPLELDDLAE